MTMSKLIFAMPGNETIAEQLGTLLEVPSGSLEFRRFPDGESYVRIATPVAGASVALTMTLGEPDSKIPPLLFAANTLRELGATRIGLIAPYLAYMRQDRRFNAGEAVTSRQFAALLSEAFDWLVTVDPHLHRYRDLSEIYTIPTAIAHAAPALAAWVGANVENPLLIAPDVESLQWVASVGKLCRAPWISFRKIRLGDRRVQIESSGVDLPKDRTPVILDDIISSGETMLQAVRLLGKQIRIAPICIAVHGLFSELSDAALEAEGARLVCTNTVPNRHAEIDVSNILAQSAGPFLGDLIIG